MSYSFDYTTPPVLQANNLGYLVPFNKSSLTLVFTNSETGIYDQVPPGVYNFTFSCNVIADPTTVASGTAVDWFFYLFGTGSFSIVSNRFYPSPTFTLGGLTISSTVGSSITLCTTFTIPSTKNLILSYYGEQTLIGGTGGSSPITSTMINPISSLCRIA